MSIFKKSSSFSDSINENDISKIFAESISKDLVERAKSNEAVMSLLTEMSDANSELEHLKEQTYTEGQPVVRDNVKSMMIMSKEHLDYIDLSKDDKNAVRMIFFEKNKQIEFPRIKVASGVTAFMLESLLNYCEGKDNDNYTFIPDCKEFLLFKHNEDDSEEFVIVPCSLTTFLVKNENIDIIEAKESISDSRKINSKQCSALEAEINKILTIPPIMDVK